MPAGGRPSESSQRGQSSQAQPERILILGTGLIGASTGLALRAAGFRGEIAGWDRDPRAAQTALARGALTALAAEPIAAARASDVILLAGPVFAILEWMERLAPELSPAQLVTDVGSTKRAIAEAGETLFNRPGRAGFLPGHPMAGREVSGAESALAEIFSGAVWLFTPAERSAMSAEARRLEARFRGWVTEFGCRTLELDPARHDELCAWVSHLPQYLATALSALLEERFGDAADMRDLGGRALREMTRLGASPYSMWRDIAWTNTDNVASALDSLEQRLAGLRENLRTPGLRAEFEQANRFRLPARPARDE